MVSCDNFVLVGVQSPSKIKPPADRRRGQWKNAEALPCGYIRPRRGKNARGVLEIKSSGFTGKQQSENKENS